MNKAFVSFLLFASLLLQARGAVAIEETLSFSSFGRVTLYHGSAQPTHAVLFVSGDGGWNKGVIDMARALASLDAVVVGIDITHYLRIVEASGEKCAYFAGDLEELSKFVQKKIGLPRYVAPVLVGYSSGATLVYAALAQAPPSTFRGAISLGFCPDLEVTKTPCRGAGLESDRRVRGKGYDLQPSTGLNAPWIAFQGTIDQVCPAPQTEAYVKRVLGGEIVSLPKVGHGFSIEKNWMPQFRDAFARLVSLRETKPTAGVVNDLPLIEMHAQNGLQGPLAVILSGDGGWAGIDREVGKYLVEKGISVVGLNSLQYFWSAKTPERAGADLERIIRHYSGAWNRQNVILIGYSLGADVLPFMAGGLPPEIRRNVVLITLLGPGEDAEFEFHVIDWLKQRPSKSAYPVLPAIEKLRGTKILCFYGSEEKDTVCRKMDRSVGTPIELKGGHHFGGDYAVIAKEILRRVESTQPSNASVDSP